jgi:deazaflavin-dependent oxidoreductase (nitroreductase family)
MPGVRCYLLTAPGCKTGWPRPNPVVPVEHDGRRWLLAPYGPVAWVHNARATERVRLARRRGTRDYVIWEVPPEEAGPVLKRFVCHVTVLRGERGLRAEGLRR